MNNPTKEERERWWLLCYAVISMEKAIETCRILLERCHDNKHELFPALSLAVHAYYVRPFKRSNGVGKLESHIVPDGSRGLHNALVDFRDAVFSHTDATHNKAAGRTMHNVVYSHYEGIDVFSTSDPRARLEVYRDTQKHCMKMLEIFEHHVLSFYSKYHELLPNSDGDFLLSLDENEELFIPHTMAVEGKLGYT